MRSGFIRLTGQQLNTELRGMNALTVALVSLLMQMYAIQPVVQFCDAAGVNMTPFATVFVFNDIYYTFLSTIMSLGMVALFCGCTNSPLASICLAIEVFGGQCISLFALACAVSYMLSSYFSLYREQHFLHSKLRIVGVQRVHGKWAETDGTHFCTNADGEN